MNKALTVKNPWAHAIIAGDKDVENRSRPTKHRGRLYIHAGLTWSQDGIDFMKPRGMLTGGLGEMYGELGTVIGTVDVIGCHPAEECEQVDIDGFASYCSEWSMPDHYHWVLANARPLACPFPETGRLGLWTLGGAALASVG